MLKIREWLRWRGVLNTHLNVSFLRGKRQNIWCLIGTCRASRTLPRLLEWIWTPYGATTTRAKWVRNAGPDPGHYPHPQVPARLPQRGRTHWGPSTSQRRQVFQPISFSVQFSSVAQSCPTICDPMDCSTPGFPVHHQLPELTQIHVHWVGDAIQSSHPLSCLSPPAFILSQHQGLFKWVSSLQQVAKVLDFQLKHQSFQWIFRTDFL